MLTFVPRSSAFCRRRIAVHTLALSVGLALLRASGLALADPPDANQLQEQLAAGEFGPALAKAASIKEVQVRDKWLGQIAGAQARAGERSASLNTAFDINDDRLRAAVMKETTALGGQGGGQANFEPLKDLITSTIAPQTWEDTGGQGSMLEFRNGVYVDADGVLHRKQKNDKAGGLAVARLEALKASENQDVHAYSALRKVSLTRLEKHLQLRLAAGLRPTAEMLNMAGLEKIKYVLVYPETGDIVLAGPASNWQPDAEGRLVSQHTGRSVLQLDDLVVILRQMNRSNAAQFGCSINPREAALARTKEFVEESAKTPLKESTRNRWLAQLRERMGKQDVVVDGVDPRTRVAQVLVEADYRMKLVGMGLEPGVLGVKSYLDRIEVPRGQAPPPMDVLRWWFTMNYDDVLASAAKDAFELRGQGVKVLSENELLTSLGKQVHTGKSEPLNQEFASSFTQHFAALAAKYPVYTDLQNVFDLALVGALIKSHGMADRVNWHMTCFDDPQSYQVALAPAPKTVETIINHRVINRVHVVAGVSGGVKMDPWKYVSASSVKVDKQGKLPREHDYGTPKNLPRNAWWWD